VHFLQSTRYLPNNMNGISLPLLLIKPLEYNIPERHHQARLLAVSAPHSCDWLHALLISSCGLRLDDEAVRVAVGLHLGARLCEPHAHEAPRSVQKALTASPVDVVQAERLVTTP